MTGFGSHWALGFGRNMFANALPTSWYMTGTSTLQHRHLLFPRSVSAPRACARAVARARARGGGGGGGGAIAIASHAFGFFLPALGALN